MADQPSDQDIASQIHQQEQKQERETLDKEKSRGVHPPRTVQEEVESMTSEGEDGHRLRDPQKAAEEQRTPRDDS